MSSCQNEAEVEEKTRKQREEEIRVRSKAFLKTIAENMCIPEGISGRIDVAFAINRTKIIAEVMVELGKELQQDDG